MYMLKFTSINENIYTLKDNIVYIPMCIYVHKTSEKNV